LEGVVIIQSGDDSVFRTSVGTWYEADYSKFDQSQQRDALEFSYKIMGHYGMSPVVIAALRESSRGRFKARFKYGAESGFVAGKFKCRPTGGPDTTAGNTVVGALAIWYALVQHGGKFTDPSVLIAWMSVNLGLNIKIFETRYPTFLRGMWFETGDHITWLPVPSMLLKIGKVLTEPAKIVTEKLVKRLRLSRGEVLRRVAYGMGKSPGLIPFSYPLLGPFCEKLISLGSEGHHGVDHLNVDKYVESYRPTVEHVFRGDESELRITALQAFAERYSVSIAEIEDAERLIRSVDDLPVFLAHPVFVRLVVVDYC
jgi:hypothetical protein